MTHVFVLLEMATCYTAKRRCAQKQSIITTWWTALIF